MTGRFETLIYTDCRPRQGLRGIAGLQFQARSSDAVTAAETVVKDNLLYEPPSRWMANRRPVEQYPPSFAHAWTGGHLATAAGVYLGREVNGTREGNQLTHAIVTTDPADYLGLRPAQLFGAGFWSAVPAPTTRSDPIELTAGAYSPARARDFVLAQPDGPLTLLALVSALAEAGRPGRPRVLFVGDDVATIIDWLVAGTLLVPRERALALGFKIFSTDPARCRLPIVAVPTEFAGPAGRIDNQLGYVVFDLGRHEHTPVPPTAAARRWVDLFLREDPRDVVDAVDVAAESGLATDGQQAGEEAAAALGLAAILHRMPDIRHAEPIVRWLRTGPDRLRQAYGADIADMFAEMPDRWPRQVLVLLDKVGCDGLLPGKAADVRLALIISEANAARTEGQVNGDPLPALPPDEWWPEHDDQVRQILIDALTSGVDAVRYEALLRVAFRFEAGVGPAHLADSAAAFVEYWAEHPNGGFQPERWPYQAEWIELLIAELTRQVEKGPEQQVVVGDRWGSWLMRRPLPAPPLAPLLVMAMLGAAVRRGEQRAVVVKKYLTEAGTDPLRFGFMVDALWSQSTPTDDELRLIRDQAPDGTAVPARIFDPVVARITATTSPDTSVLDLCRDLIRRGLLVAGREVHRVLEHDATLTMLIGQLRSEGLQRTRASILLQDVGSVPTRLVEARITELVESLLRTVAYVELDDLLKQQRILLEPYLRRLSAVLRDQPTAEQVSVAFYLYEGKTVLDKLQKKTLGEVIMDWLVRAPDKQVTDARRHVAKLGNDWRAQWDKTVDALARRRRRYRMMHPFGGR